MRTCKVTGLPLPANLYNDSRARPNHYRYRAPSGEDTRIEKPYAEAVALAEKANARRNHVPGKRYSLAYWAREYIEFAETQNPALLDKTGWIKSRKNAITKFAKKFDRVRTDLIEIGTLAQWWNELTFDQQHNRRSDLSRFFVYMMGQGVAKSNPFNTNDDQAHLIEKAKPSKQRLPLHEPEFWKIYEHAEQHVRDAMVISLVTTLRRSDVVKLTFDMIADDALRVTVGKSVGQRGFARASHLEWPFDKHTALRDAINAARERSLSLKRCPYIVAAFTDKTSENKTHEYQVLPDVITKGFKRARDKTGLWPTNQLQGRRPPSFHEIRGLAIERMLASGADIREVQRVAAHTDESITSGYAANHAPEYEVVNLASPITIPS